MGLTSHKDPFESRAALLAHTRVFLEILLLIDIELGPDEDMRRRGDEEVRRRGDEEMRRRGDEEVRRGGGEEMRR